MRIEYELKFRDYLLFSAAHQLLSIPAQVLYLSFAGFIFVIALSMAQNSVPIALLHAVIVYFVMWVAQLLFSVIYLYSRQNKSLLTRHAVEVQADAFYVETKFSRSYYYWAGIQKVVSRPGFIAVYINAHMAHIIPARAFATKDEALRFLSLIHSHLNAA